MRQIWKSGLPETKYLWDASTDEFLDLPRHILEFATTENHNKLEIHVVGRSGCTDGMQCSRDVENRGKARMHWIAVVNRYIACICS